MRDGEDQVVVAVLRIRPVPGDLGLAEVDAERAAVRQGDAIGELRAAIPLGLTQSDLTWPAGYGRAVAGNVAPVPFIIAALRTIGEAR